MRGADITKWRHWVGLDKICRF